MLRYSVGGRSAATAATADNVGAALWNPATVKPIFLYEVWGFKTVSTADNPGLVLISARGTASLTVTPTIANNWDTALAPESGALLDLTYTVQPTVVSPYKARTNLPAAIGSGFIWIFSRPITIKAGSGVAIATPVATILQPLDVTFVWEE